MCCRPVARRQGSTATPFAAERPSLAVSGAAAGRPDEGVPPSFSIIGTKEAVP